MEKKTFTNCLNDVYEKCGEIFPYTFKCKNTQYLEIVLEVLKRFKKRATLCGVFGGYGAYLAGLFNTFSNIDIFILESSFEVLFVLTTFKDLPGCKDFNYSFTHKVLYGKSYLVAKVELITDKENIILQIIYLRSNEVDKKDWLGFARRILGSMDLHCCRYGLIPTGNSILPIRYACKDFNITVQLPRIEKYQKKSGCNKSNSCKCNLCIYRVSSLKELAFESYAKNLLQ